MASSDPSRKRGREEVPPPPPAEPEEVPPTPAEPEEVLPPSPEEVPSPPPEEVKRLKSPRCKVQLPMRAPSVNVEDACFSMKMLYQPWQSLKKMAVHHGVQWPPEPLQKTVMDYAFKVNALARHLKREVVPPDDDDDGGVDVSSFGSDSDSDSDSDGGAPPAVTTSAELICSFINVFFQCAC
jgi:hypothetical protein